VSILHMFVNSNTGDVAEWLGMGLQSPVTGFDSRRRLHCFVDADLIFAGAQSEAID